MTLIDKAEALLPCPFCGGDAPRKFNNCDEFGRQSHGVQCTFGDCWICGPECETEAEAIAAWNRRAAERAKVVKLREACLPLQNLHMWTESAEDTEMVIVSVGTIRAIRAAITEADQ